MLILDFIFMISNYLSFLMESLENFLNLEIIVLEILNCKEVVVV